jgi:hypothetical protein
MRPTILVSLSTLLLAACASGTGGGSTGAPSSSVRRDADIITVDEISTASGQTVFDVVRALRPAWLRRSRPTAMMQQNESELLVYVDGARFGDVESLRQIVPSTVQNIRYYSSSAAQAKFGAGNLQGAIEVTTKQ